MNKTEQLRSLPSVDEVLRINEISALKAQCPHTSLVGWIRASVDLQRSRILAGESIDVSPELAVVAEVLKRAQSDSGQSLQRVINATGIMLHTNLGRAPMAQRAIDRVNQAAAFTNVELDLQSGKRSKRGQRVMQLLSQLTGAEDAIVVNNCAAATMLVLQAIAGGKEVIISRGQLVEIGGGFRLPNVFEAAGVRLREVGTTNRTYVRDYENAINDDTGALMRVHHSNFKLSGFVTEPTIAELIAADRPNGLPVIDDVGSGCIGDLSRFGVQEPNVIQSVAAGADVTLFSGDKLFGGPQAGIVVGKTEWIDKLRSNPMMRALRVDKLTLAALEATTEIHLSGTAEAELPLMKMLCKDPAQIRETCEVVVAHVIAAISLDRNLTIEVTASESQVGGGSVPGVGIPSFAICIGGCKADVLAQQLRTAEQPIQARVSDDRLWLDLRSVADGELAPLTQCLTKALTQVAPEPSA